MNTGRGGRMSDSSPTSGDDSGKTPSMPRIDPYEARHIPYVRLNRVGLELLVAELDRLGNTTIETDTLKNIESLDALSGYNSSALQGLRLFVSNSETGSHVSVTISKQMRHGQAWVYSTNWKNKDEGAKSAVFARVCALLEHYSVVWIPIALQIVASLLTLTAGMITGISLSLIFNPGQRPNIIVVAVMAGLASALLIVIAVLVPQRRAKVQLINQASWWRRNSDLIIGTTIATIIGTVIATFILKAF